jgi:hypothetical protein
VSDPAAVHFVGSRGTSPEFRIVPPTLAELFSHFVGAREQHERSVLSLKASAGMQLLAEQKTIKTMMSEARGVTARSRLLPCRESSPFDLFDLVGLAGVRSDDFDAGTPCFANE